LEKKEYQKGKKKRAKELKHKKNHKKTKIKEKKKKKNQELTLSGHIPQPTPSY